MHEVRNMIQAWCITQHLPIAPVVEQLRRYTELRHSAWKRYHNPQDAVACQNNTPHPHPTPDQPNTTIVLGA